MTELLSYFTAHNDDTPSTSQRRFSVRKGRWPHTFKAALNENRRPSPKDRLLTQKIIVDEFIHCGEIHCRSIFKAIANPVVDMSPASFENDSGTGVKGFARSLETTYYNHHSIRHAMAEKRKQRALNSTTSKCPRKTPVKDSYGCSQWQPTAFSDGEGQESMEEKKTWLQHEYQKRDKNISRVVEHMKSTYINQRYEINKQPASLHDVKQSWPFLFQPRHLSDHFQYLVGQETNTVFTSNVASKCSSILQFMSEKKKISDRWQLLIKDGSADSPSQATVSSCSAICTFPQYFREEDFFL